MADRNGYIGRAPSDSAVTVARQTFSPTGVTTDFTFASGYTPGYFDIFINGVKMIEGSDYTSTDGSTFSVLNGGAVSGDVIEGVAYKAFNAATATVGISSAGTPISTQANTLNFVGTGNTFALRGSTIDISISGGGAGAGGTWANYDTNTGVSTTKKVKIQNDLEVTGVTTSTGGFVGNVTGTATGLSGSPNITINNLTGVAATFTGVLTYEDVTNIDSLGIITARSHVSIADSILHTGDTDTSIRFPAADTFTVETAGSEAIRVDSSGRLLLGTTVEGFEYADNFTLADSGNCGITIRSGDTSYGSIYFSDATSGGGEYIGVIEYNHNGNVMSFNAGGGPKLKLNSVDGKTADITGNLFVSGVATATAYHGDGSNLTGIAAGITTTKYSPTANAIIQIGLGTAQHHELTLTAGFTTITTSGGSMGESHSLVLIQPSSGIATVGFSTFFQFPSGATPSMSEGSSKVDLVSFVVKDIAGNTGTGATELLASAGLNYS